MKLILMLISMLIVCYLTAQYMTSPSIRGVPGHEGGMAPEQVLDHTQEQINKINEDAAKRATMPMPAP